MQVAISLAVVLQLSNLAGAPPSIVADAQTQVTRVYRAIGVALQWQTVGSATDAHAIYVVLLPIETGELRRAADTVMGAAMRTAEGTSLAYVFYRRVEQQANSYDVSSATVLAYALSHELGHLLLASRAHSPVGLMRASWRRAEFHQAAEGQLRFSGDEAADIRRILAIDVLAEDRRAEAAGRCP